MITKYEEDLGTFKNAELRGSFLKRSVANPNKNLWSNKSLVTYSVYLWVTLDRVWIEIQSPNIQTHITPINISMLQIF